MTAFAAWGLTVLGLATVMTVAEMLLPQGNTRKVIRSVFATVTALTIITPLPSLIKSGGTKFDFSSGEVALDGAYIERMDEIKGGLIADALRLSLEDAGFTGGYTLYVEADGFGVKSVTVKFDDSGMSGDGGHINKSELVGLIAEYLHIGEEAIMTYG